MASDSESRNFFRGPLEAPQKLHFGKQKACEAISELSWPTATAAAAELQSTISYSSSFLTAPVEKVFFLSVLMTKPHRACTH